MCYVKKVEIERKLQGALIYGVLRNILNGGSWGLFDWFRNVSYMIREQFVFYILSPFYILSL
jgi:hypothetical protein